MNKVKVILDEANGRAAVVDARQGEKLADGFTFDPVPVCRLNVGYGRPWAAVKADAERIAAALNAPPADPTPA